MDLPIYTPVLYFGIGVLAGVAGTFGFALWFTKREAPASQKSSRKWSKLENLSFDYHYDIRARANGTYADLMAELCIIMAKQMRENESFRQNGQAHECVYSVAISGTAHFIERPATETLQGSAVDGFPKA